MKFLRAGLLVVGITLAPFVLFRIHLLMEALFLASGASAFTAMFLGSVSAVAFGVATIMAYVSSLEW